MVKKIIFYTLIVIFIFRVNVVAESINCPMWQAELNDMINIANEKVGYIEGLIESEYYSNKIDQFTKDINDLETIYNELYGFYDMHLDHCQFLTTSVNEIDNIYNKIVILRATDPTNQAPACDYLGANTIALIQDIFNIVKILVPALLILFGSFDLAKAVLAGSEKDMKAAQKSLIQRFLAGIAIYFIPMILNLILSFIGITDATCSIV